MFILSALVYPCLLELMCVGAGLLVDRLCGRFIPAVLLPALGAATLIAVTQLTTYQSTTSRATPVVIAVVGAGGIALEWRRIKAAVLRPRSRRWQLWLPGIVYCLALAPVLAFGQTTFTAYNVLSDSAFHMMGADYLIRHGQDYAHLDLANSYGQYIAHYYATGYPSGADTLFGGSAFVLGLPMIWAFQPFNAFMVAIAAGPAWLLARRSGLPSVWAALAGLTATLPALVYGYELIGSIKEITALPLVLAMGGLVVMHERWLPGPPRRAAPFALLAAAGVSALGVGFGVWIAASVLVLGALAISEVAARRRSPARLALLVLVGATVAAVAALPTWTAASGSLENSAAVATTANPGNLQTPLRIVQVFGTWLSGLYTTAPSGTGAVLSDVAMIVTVAAAAVGVVFLARRRDLVFFAWMAALLVLALLLLAFTSTWINAKTLMLSSPIVVLLAWSGISAFVHARLAWIAGLIAVVLTAGVFASDFMQYQSTDLAPPARYAQLASLDTRFAGRGPTLYTDWDEYALYELRDLDVGGPNFQFRPPALSHVVAYHSAPVNLDLISPRAFIGYPLIITRIDPLTSRPPYAYRLLWRDDYYQVWGRRPHAPPALAHLGLYDNESVGCARVAPIAQIAASHDGYLAVAIAPLIVDVPINRPSPRDTYVHHQLLLSARAAGVSVTFSVPRSGLWDLWLRGEVMSSVSVRVDGRQIAILADQLDGNDSDPDTIGPLRVRLRAGRHRLAFTPTGSSLVPGASGVANLVRIFLTASAGGGEERVRTLPASDWLSLCGGLYDWIEAIPR